MVHEVEVKHNEHVDITNRQGASQCVKIFAIVLAEGGQVRLRNLLPHRIPQTDRAGSRIGHHLGYVPDEVHLVIG